MTAIALSAIALALALAAILLWLRTDRRAQRAQTQLLEVLERELAHQRRRNAQLELTADSDRARHSGGLDPFVRDHHLEQRLTPGPSGVAAGAVVSARPGELPLELQRELAAVEDLEAREELEQEARRLHAMGEPPAAIVAALFEGA